MELNLLVRILSLIRCLMHFQSIGHTELTPSWSEGLSALVTVPWIRISVESDLSPPLELVQTLCAIPGWIVTNFKGFGRVRKSLLFSFWSFYACHIKKGRFLRIGKSRVKFLFNFQNVVIEEYEEVRLMLHRWLLGALGKYQPGW